MDLNAKPMYEEHFTAFVDLLGFSEVSTITDDAARLKILNLLLSLSALRGEFDVQSTAEETGTRSYIKPAISTFSDHIVISYPLEPISTRTGFDEQMTAISILFNFNQLLTRIASAALSIGFLIRGGATIGKLYHAGGVVFGEALVDAYQIESRTSIYPRVVLSSQITSRPVWLRAQSLNLLKGVDGLYHFNYFTMLALSAPPGEHWAENVMAWYHNAVFIISRNLAELESRGRLNELSKWSWFAHEFRSALERMPPEMLKSLGISLDALSWPR
jgi:hypothetical protein